jgi:uncharacterized RDD family membrane protein YckC
LNCPSCTAALLSFTDPCPSCGRRPSPPSEGALAPDLSRLIPSRIDAVRDVPGRRKKEPAWKDEVRQRVRQRRAERLGTELPLFPEGPTESAPEGVLETDIDMAPPTVEIARPAAGESADGPRLVWSMPGETDEPAQKTLVLDPAAPPIAVERWSLGDGADERSGADPADRFGLGVEGWNASGAAARTPDRFARGGEERFAPSAERFVQGAEEVPEPSIRERAVSSHEDWEPIPAPVERPAQWTDRLQAAAFDLGLLSALWAVVIYFASRAARVSVDGLWVSWPYLVGYLGFLGVVYAVYFTGTCGRTVGKIVCGLKVVDVAGLPPTYPRAFARVILGTAGTLLGMVGLLPIFFDPARRAAHDRLLRTRVVKY